MRVKGVEGGELELRDDAVAGLRGRLRGPLLVNGDPGYEDSRTLWNAMIDRRPALVARCVGAADVVACVNFAREHGVLLAIKGGGHNIAGLAVCEGGLQLDLSAMRGVWVDAAAKRAFAQGGCLLGDVDRETQLHGLAAVLGFVSNTGVAGLTLGGGFGYLTRRYGWTIDNVLSMEMVAADGRLLRASEREHSDLFWGLCGGGGNFGVVTGIEYRLHPVGPEVVGGAIAWRLAEAKPALEAFRRMVDDGPAEAGCALVVRPAPPAPWIAKEAHGQLIVVLVVCHTGPLESAERAIAPLKALGTPVGDVLQRRTYVSQQSLLDATQPKGRRYYWKSEYLTGLEDELLAKVVDHAQRVASPHSGIVLFPVRGAISERSDDASAAGNRNSHTVLNIAASWEQAEDDRTNIEWARTAWNDTKRFSTGGTYVNFLNEDDRGDRTEAAYGANLGRLVEVKNRWDPGNRFRMNKNIAPRMAPA
jgi:FAD/FMN-containing dehydrogenase